MNDELLSMKTKTPSSLCLQFGEGVFFKVKSKNAKVKK
jgi:hypothetical protein